MLVEVGSRAVLGEAWCVLGGCAGCSPVWSHCILRGPGGGPVAPAFTAEDTECLDLVTAPCHSYKENLDICPERKAGGESMQLQGGTP